MLHRTFKSPILGRQSMAEEKTRADLTSSLDEGHRELLIGGGLSRRFTKLPLWLSHPSNIGAFYGLLVSTALILPYATTEEFWFPLWLLHASLLISATAFLGIISRLINALTGRMPLPINRKILYPIPFIGFTFLTLIHTELLVNNNITIFTAWCLLMAPGPIYIHLSWAPRWRLLCMIEDGKNPFKGVPIKEYLNEDKDDEIVIDDSELMAVVDSFQIEEE